MTETAQQTTPAVERHRRKVRLGTVVSDKMDKTVVVQVTDRKSHPLYKKTVQRRVRFKAHDEANECKTGDLVRIMETRPISRDKRWRVVEVVEKAR
jgi:small subunit ribosomal protein S17